MFVLACIYLPVVSFPSVGDGVIEEERAEEHEGQYRELEPEDQYRDQEAADAYVSEGKFLRPLRERLHPCEDV